MNRARYTPKAREDIDQIAEYIAADNLDAAIRFCLAIEDAAEKLAEMPGMGTVCNFSSPRQFQ
jgi:plasmid stabilization system protein ParE